MKTLLLALIGLLGVLPLSWRSFFGGMAGRIASFVPTRDRRIADLQMRCFLKTAPAKRLIPLVYASIGQTLFESFNLHPFLRQSAKFVYCPEWDVAERLLAQKKGILALTAHTGNWDLLAAYIVSKGIELSAVGREARSRTWQQILQALRNQYGIQTIWRSSRSGLKEIIERLRCGQVVAALIDQDTRVKSISSLFFGRPAATPVTLIKLALDLNTLIVASFIFRTGFNRYQIFIHEIKQRDNAAQVLDEYHQCLEQLIRRYPWQWVWFHKRWRTRPDGTRMSSQEYVRYLENIQNQGRSAC